MINENTQERFCNLCGKKVLENDQQYQSKDHVGEDFTLCLNCQPLIATVKIAEPIAKEMCDTILKTRSNHKDAQNIGITILNKFEGNKEHIVPELIELAFYVQSSTRNFQSERDRFNDLCDQLKTLCAYAPHSRGYVNK